ncbi:hypothetical protein Tco_1416234, partial [Tanacetum coccineum]
MQGTSLTKQERESDDLNAYDSMVIKPSPLSKVRATSNVNFTSHVMTSSEQSNVVNHSETEITSDSNIIPYSQYLLFSKNDFKKEESRNIDKEIVFEKRIKQLDNIVFKRDQPAQTVHMLTKPYFFYDHTIKQALGFQNPFHLKKAQQLEPKLYDGNVIKNMSAIVILDSKETL